MKWLSLLLPFILVGVCLAADQQPESKPQHKEPTYFGKAINEWIASTDDKRREQRRAAISEWVEEIDNDAMPTLTKLLKDADSYVRREAAYGLGQLGSDAKATIPALTKLLQEQDSDVRQAAVDALGKIGGTEAVPTFTKLLQEKDWEVRQAAADALGEIGPDAVPILKKLLKDKDLQIRRSAASA